MSDIRLISFNLCPFVQRSVITLLEKDIPFQIEYIDLRNKPDWFMKISPLGQVPVLQTQGVSLFESAVINEYLDETAGQPFMPADALERAQHRMWIAFSSTLMTALWTAQSTHDPNAYTSAIASIKNQCHRLNDTVKGPLFFGTQFSLVDAAIAPALQRLEWMIEMDDQFDVFADNPKLRTWWEALKSKESLQKSVVPEIKELFAGMITALGGRLHAAAQ